EWFVDRVADALPQPWVLSLPLWVYRVVMLAWSLWLAWALMGWIGWAWKAYLSGALWRRREKPTRATTAPTRASTATGAGAATAPPPATEPGPPTGSSPPTAR